MLHDAGKDQVSNIHTSGLQTTLEIGILLAENDEFDPVHRMCCHYVVKIKSALFLIPVITDTRLSVGLTK